MRKQDPAIITVIVLMVFLSGFLLVSGHSGRTDSNGGHHDYNNASGLGSYHYHHGYPAHLHTDGSCPYEQDSMTSGINQTSSQNSDSQNAYSDSYSKGYNKGFDSAKTYYKDRYDNLKENNEYKITELQNERNIFLVCCIVELLIILFSLYKLYKTKKGGRLNS